MFNMFPFIYQRKTKNFLLWLICYLMNKKHLVNDNLIKWRRKIR